MLILKHLEAPNECFSPLVKKLTHYATIICIKMTIFSVPVGNTVVTTILTVQNDLVHIKSLKTKIVRN